MMGLLRLPSARLLSLRLFRSQAAHPLRLGAVHGAVSICSSRLFHRLADGGGGGNGGGGSILNDSKPQRSALLGAVYLLIFDCHDRAELVGTNWSAVVRKRAHSPNAWADWRILLLKRRNTGYADGFYSLVSGHLDNGEAILDAAVREAKEEVGIQLDPKDLEIVSCQHRKSKEREYLDFYVKCGHYVGLAKNMEPEKCEEVKFFEVGKLPNLMIPTVKLGLMNSLTGVSFYEDMHKTQSDATSGST